MGFNYKPLQNIGKNIVKKIGKKTVIGAAYLTAGLMATMSCSIFNQDSTTTPNNTPTTEATETSASITDLTPTPYPTATVIAIENGLTSGTITSAADTSNNEYRKNLVDGFVGDYPIKNEIDSEEILSYEGTLKFLFTEESRTIFSNNSFGYFSGDKSFVYGKEINNEKILFANELETIGLEINNSGSGKFYTVNIDNRLIYVDLDLQGKVKRIINHDDSDMLYRFEQTFETSDGLNIMKIEYFNDDNRIGEFTVAENESGVFTALSASSENGNVLSTVLSSTDQENESINTTEYFFQTKDTPVIVRIDDDGIYKIWSISNGPDSVIIREDGNGSSINKFNIN